MQTEFTFETTPWERAICEANPGEKFSCAKLLLLLEGEEEESVEAAFSLLEEKGIALDISDLPKLGNTGEAALRLRREAELSRKENFWKSLEETDPLRLFLEEIYRENTDEDIKTLACDRSEAGMQNLANAMLPYVVEQAKRLTDRGVLLMDLIQEGSLGLWQAILSYRSGDFLDHSMWRIENAMAKAVFLQAQAGGIGQKMRQGMEDYRDVDQRLLTELGRNPTVEEIAEELHISPEEAKTLENALTSARLKQRVEQARVPKEPTPEDNQAVEDTAYFQMRQRISELLSSLSAEDGKLLSLRFGLEGGLPMSPSDVARELKITPEEVLTREAAALAALRSENNG